MDMDMLRVVMSSGDRDPGICQRLLPGLGQGGRV